MQDEGDQPLQTERKFLELLVKIRRRDPSLYTAAEDASISNSSGSSDSDSKDEPAEARRSHRPKYLKDVLADQVQDADRLRFIFSDFESLVIRLFNGIFIPCRRWQRWMMTAQRSRMTMPRKAHMCKNSRIFVMPFSRQALSRTPDTSKAQAHRRALLNILCRFFHKADSWASPGTAKFPKSGQLMASPCASDACCVNVLLEKFDLHAM